MTLPGASVTCGNCGTLNSAADSFCFKCGYPLSTGSTATSTHIHPRNATAPTVLSSTTPALSTATRRVTGTLQPATVLEGRYRIVRSVGEGGFGAVYEAIDERFQVRRSVAIKEMSDSHLNPGDRAGALQQFRDEANLLVALRHSNLPAVTDFFEEADKAYLVMDFVEGETLEKIQEDYTGPLPEQRVLSWALQLCDVLNYLHSQPHPIIFRDLKPSNVMITPDDSVKLIDFGIARTFKSTATKDTTSLGSRGYAPLEQYGWGQTDHRSDLYALGATMYDLLTGRTPPEALARRVRPDLFEKPRTLNPSLSPAIEQIIVKAMDEEPQMRFQSANEMRQALLEMAATQQTPLPPAPTTPTQPPGGLPPAQSQPPSRRISRRTVLIAGGTLAAAGVAAGTGLALTGHLPQFFMPASMKITLAYSTEKQGWIETAIERFHTRNILHKGRPIRIETITSGSLDMAEQIVQGNIRPVVWSPASSIEINRAQMKWGKQNGGELFLSNETRTLALSPFVFGIWKDRADALLGKYQRVDWDTLYEALQLKHGWADIGPQYAGWRAIKLAQTRPISSNGGLLAITLMAYAFFKQTQGQGLTVAKLDDPTFTTFFDQFESRVYKYGRSSGSYLHEVLLLGSSACDIVLTYENLILFSYDNKRKAEETLFPFYPIFNIISDHPFAILQGKSDEVAAARLFQQFLLEKEQQQLALHYGLRPVHPDVQLTDQTPEGNLFLTPALKPYVEPYLKNNTFSLVQDPRLDVVEKILKIWVDGYGGYPVANG